MHKIAVVGCGHWGKNLIRNFNTLGALHYICDNNEEIAHHFALEYDVKALTFEEIINSNDITGVVIAAPAPLHSELAISALNLGKHVFVEKPLATNLDDAKKITIAAESNNKHLMVGHLLQYHPVFIELKNYISRGNIGKIEYLYSNRLSLGKIRADENIIWSFAPHDISMILSLVNSEPNKLIAIGNNQLDRPILDRAIIHMDFEDKVQAHIEVSWVNPYKQHKLVVVGSEGTLVFDDSKSWAEKLVLFNHIIDSSSIPPTIQKAEGINLEVPESEPLKNECEHFLKLLDDKVMPLTDGEEGMRVLKVLNATDQSILSGGYVKL